MNRVYKVRRNELRRNKLRRNKLRLDVSVVQDIPISMVFGRDAIHCVFTIRCNVSYQRVIYNRLDVIDKA